MPTWNDMKSGFRTVTNKVIAKTDELAEETALMIKKKTVEAHLSEAYEKLGKIAYQLLSENAEIASNDAFTEASKDIERLSAELHEAKERIRRFKEKKQKDRTE